MTDAVDSLILDLLEWIGPNPKPYSETLEAWRTSCPRLPVWEEAIAKGLVRRTNGSSMREAKVLITDEGRQALKTAHVPPTATFVSKNRLDQTS